MLSISQSRLPGKLTTPLGEDELGLVEMTSEEGLSQLFEIVVRAVSPSADVDFDQLLGRAAHVELDCDKMGKRCYHGLIMEGAFEHMEPGGLFYYRLVLRPWFYLLGKTTDCRIHHDKTVEDIIKETLNRRGFTAYRFETQASYPKLHYTVQYRETDLNFLCRLMEQHGIYYFFEHASDKHTLVFADGRGAHKPAPGQASVALSLGGVAHLSDEDAWIHSWQDLRTLRSGKFELNDYYHIKPKASLIGNRTASEKYDHSQLEVFDHPGVHTERDHGEFYARIRLEAEQAVDKRRVAHGTAVAIFPGAMMSLTKHPRSSENKSWIVVRVSSRFGRQDYSSAHGTELGFRFEARYELHDPGVQYRAPFVTPKPLIHSLQPATVVGAEGEEIDCDGHGRILVHFFWDRHGDKSCRVRVSQVWSGQSWGGQVIPRIGMEVMVAYLDGDPDRPIVVGSVPNPETMKVPYTLPDFKTRMVLRSNSHKSRGRNEMTMEDQTEHENLFLHAQRDSTQRVLNNHTERVDANHVFSAGANRAVDVGGNYKTEVAGSMNLVVGGTGAAAAALMNPLKELSSQTAGMLSAGGGGGVAPSVGGTTLGFYSGDGLTGLKGVTSGSDPTQDAGDKLRSAGALVGQDVGSILASPPGTMNTVVGANKTDSVGVAQSETIGVVKVTNVGQNFFTHVGDTMVIDVGTKLDIIVGKSRFTMENDGTISLYGVLVKVKGSKKILLNCEGE